MRINEYGSMDVVRTRLLSLVALIVAAVGANAQGARTAQLRLWASIADYASPIYAKGPAEGADVLFFRGEPARFQITAANRNATPLRVQFPYGADWAVSVAEATRDGQPISVDLIPRRGVTRAVHQGDVVPLNNAELVSFEPQDRIDWYVEVADRLQPGLYTMTFSVRGYDKEGRHIPGVDQQMRFEVREPTTESTAEITVREAYRYLWSEPPDLKRARAAVDRLLRINPTSFAAQGLLGSIESKRGNSKKATEHNTRKRDLFMNDRDTLFLKYHSPEEVASMKAHYEG